MYKRPARSLFGPLIALALAAMPGTNLAQNNNQPVGPTAAKIQVMQTMLDKGFTQRDLLKIVGLLQDLRDAKQACMAKEDQILAELVRTKADQQKMSGDTRMQECQRMLADRRQSIWSTISDRIGADKANALHRYTEPVTEDVSRVAYTDEILQGIEKSLAELDRLAAARIAANGGLTDVSGVRPASVETTVTTTTTFVPGKPIYVTTSAAISENDLVRLVEDRIVAHEVHDADYMIYLPTHTDLTSEDVSFLRQESLRIWW